MHNYHVGYKTENGKAIIGNSLDVLNDLDNNSISLVITSPPFALEGRKKSYGNLEGFEYINWLTEFAKIVYDKLKPDGSFVLDLGAAYNKGEPTYNLYQFRILLKFCDEIGFKLAQPFYWHNPSALPSPIEWVNKRKIRAKNSVNTIWWFSKTSRPKSDVKNILVPYSDRMKKLIQNPDEFVKESTAERPSGYVMSKTSWSKDNGGAIPPNLLQISNSESNSQYLRYCKKLGIKAHPARFPLAIPEFFIKFLTEENDLVVDIFGGSNTTGEACEKLNRKWITIELNDEYVAASSFRFCKNVEEAEIYFEKIKKEESIEL